MITPYVGIFEPSDKLQIFSEGSIMGISKNPNFLSIIANVLMQGVTVQELQVASNGYNEAVVHLL